MATGNKRAHLITGGFPPGSSAGHDMDYARLQLLQKLSKADVTTANDFQAGLFSSRDDKLRAIAPRV